MTTPPTMTTPHADHVRALRRAARALRDLQLALAAFRDGATDWEGLNVEEIKYEIVDPTLDLVLLSLGRLPLDVPTAEGRALLAKARKRRLGCPACGALPGAPTTSEIAASDTTIACPRCDAVRED